jgi:hypothetical protein
VDHEGEAIELQSINELTDRRRMCLGRIGKCRGTVGEAEAEVVGCNAAVARRQRGNQVAELE